MTRDFTAERTEPATGGIERTEGDNSEWRYQQGSTSKTRIGSGVDVVRYKDDNDERERCCGEACSRFYRPKEHAIRAGSHEYELTRRNRMSRVEGLKFDPKTERELGKAIDEVAIRIDAERPSLSLLAEVLSGIASPMWRHRAQKVTRGDPDDLEGFIDRISASIEEENSGR